MAKMNNKESFLTGAFTAAVAGVGAVVGTGLSGGTLMVAEHLDMLEYPIRDYNTIVAICAIACASLFSAKAYSETIFDSPKKKTFAAGFLATAVSVSSLAYAALDMNEETKAKKQAIELSVL